MNMIQMIYEVSVSTSVINRSIIFMINHNSVVVRDFHDTEQLTTVSACLSSPIRTICKLILFKSNKGLNNNGGWTAEIHSMKIMEYTTCKRMQGSSVLCGSSGWLLKEIDMVG